MVVSWVPRRRWTPNLAMCSVCSADFEGSIGLIDRRESEISLVLE